MKTVLTTDPAEAAAFITSGGVVAFPTETVYGLGADVFNPAALARVFEAKRRPADNPLIAHIADLDQIQLLSNAINETAQRFIESFFPGPLTIVVEKTAEVPIAATAGLDTIGIRMPAFEIAHDFLTLCKTPVAAPSANLSGRPSPTTWPAVAEDLDGRIDCILQGDPTIIGIESTVVDCTTPRPIVLRSGSVTLEQLRIAVPETCWLEKSETVTARSPGMKHVHYSPLAQVVVIDDPSNVVGGGRSAYIGVSPSTKSFGIGYQADDVEEYAHAVFEFFRECDRGGIETIYCERVDDAGIGAALMDRIERAANKAGPI